MLAEERKIKEVQTLEYVFDASYKIFISLVLVGAMYIYICVYCCIIGHLNIMLEKRETSKK